MHRMLSIMLFVFLSHVHAFEQKDTQNLGSKQPILLLFRTSDYNVANTITNLVTKTLCTLNKCTKNFQ